MTELERLADVCAHKSPVVEFVGPLFQRLEPQVREGYILAYWSSDPQSNHPLFWTNRSKNIPHWNYLGGGAAIYSTYDEAARAGDELPWIRDLPPKGKRVLKIKLRSPVEILEDYPVDVLDALSEIK